MKGAENAKPFTPVDRLYEIAAPDELLASGADAKRIGVLSVVPCNLASLQQASPIL